MAKVELISYVPNVWESISHAAKNCYCKPVNPELAREIILNGHSSIAEFSYFHFHISGMSRAASHQFVRQRIGIGLAQRSQRYVDESAFEFVTPPSINNLLDSNPYVHMAYSTLMDDIQGVYDLLVKAGVPKEDARFVLPNACETHMDACFNARSLMHFFGTRRCRRAQWEIRDIADQMSELIKSVDQMLYDTICGPNCQQLGHCPEGSRSCGLR